MKRTLVVLLLAAVMMLFAVSCKEEAHEHTWDEGKVTTPATCTDPGVKTYTCECGETKTEAIPALGHNWNEGVVTTPATCSTAGVKTYTCQNDNTHTKTEAVPATGEHSWGEWVITTPATCDAAGVKTATCSSGGETKTENIPAIGHVWGEPTYSDGKTTWTCTNDGTHTKVVEGKVLMTVGETVTGYATLDAAIAAIEEGQTAVIVINEDISISDTIAIENRNVTLMNRGGATVTIQDAVATHATDTGSTSNQVARMFQINGSSVVVITGNTTGTLKFQGAAAESDAFTAGGARRVMFFMGAAKADMASGSITVNAGVEVTGINSTGGTSFGSFVRGYGNVTVNGGNYHDNYQNGNALFCVYGTTVVNGGTFKNNSSGGSSSCFQNCGTLTLNDATFENNTQNYGVIVGATPSNTTINGGTFKNNASSNATGGSAIYTNSAATAVFTINGGTFEDNTKYDYYETAKGAFTIGTVSFTTNKGTYVNGVLQAE